MQAHPQMKRTIGKNIARLRAERGLSRRAFGDLIGVDQMLVYKWERGAHRPNDDNLAALARATGRDIGWFYTDHPRSAT